MLGTKLKSTIDMREAYTLWDLLNSKYQILEKIFVYEGFIHDPDLKITLRLATKFLEKNITILEKAMNNYSIESPGRNRAAAQLAGRSDAITDEYIASDVFLYYQGHVENLLKAFYASSTNDGVRNIIKTMAARTITETDYLVHYLRNKGWLASSPMAKTTLPAQNKALALAEAASLFDHLTYRYDTLYITDIFLGIARDLELRATLSLGSGRLQKQITALEKKLRVFCIPFPKRPANFTLSLNDTRIFNDDTIYRTIASFMQGAGNKHAQAFKQATVNDNIREFFKDLIIEEMDDYNGYVKLGKLKGWLNAVPMYNK